MQPHGSYMIFTVTLELDACYSDTGISHVSSVVLVALPKNREPAVEFLGEGSSFPNTHLLDPGSCVPPSHPYFSSTAIKAHTTAEELQILHILDIFVLQGNGTPHNSNSSVSCLQRQLGGRREHPTKNMQQQAMLEHFGGKRLWL